MILNFHETRLVASCGWIEKAGLRVIDLQTQREEVVVLGDAGFVILKKALNNLFVCAHYAEGEFVTLSIHSFESPEVRLSAIKITSKAFEFQGNANLWQFAPQYYIGFLKDDLQGADFRLIKIDAKSKSVNVSRLEWFDGTYDKGYQSVTDVLAIPRTTFLLYAIQRDSTPVLYDIQKKAVDRKLKLAGRTGNPVFALRNGFKELWVSDYDHLFKLDAASFKTLAKKRLQPPSFGMSQQFLGEFSFSPNERFCAVARPFSKDVLLMDPVKFKVIATAKTKGQPLSIALATNLDFIARDWKSGAVEYGAFKV